MVFESMFGASIRTLPEAKLVSGDAVSSPGHETSNQACAPFIWSGDWAVLSPLVCVA